MAFEAFRNESKGRPRRTRLMIAVSIAFHAVLLSAGVAYSFWHIDELTPPTVKVTFLSAAPPPPPPPPPAGGGGAARKKPVIRPKTPTKVAELVQPRETPKEEPRETKPDPTEGPGERGGVKGGVIGGTIGGTGAPKFLPPNLAKGLKSSGDNPAFPAALRKPGAVYRVLAKYCITVTGTVDQVKIMQSAGPELDESVQRTVRSWHFRPYLSAAGSAVPFCTVEAFEFRTE